MVPAKRLVYTRHLVMRNKDLWTLPGFCRTIIENALALIPYLYNRIKVDRVGLFEPTCDHSNGLSINRNLCQYQKLAIEKLSINATTW
jgi:hypothetical protein